MTEDAAHQAAGHDVEAQEPRPRPLRSALDIVAVALAAVMIAGWSVLFVGPRLSAMRAGAVPAQWSDWIGQWATPVVLILLLLLFFLRSGRREARRFSHVAVQLRDEAAMLEKRLGAMNNELSLAREFIAAQARDLDSLGRVAGERLAVTGDRLAALITNNSQQVEVIAAVSQTALDNMDRLRGQLPVIASTARDVTNNIANAGRAAHAQMAEMIAGFDRLNESGQASERQVMAVRGHVDAALAAFQRQADQLHDIAAQRFAALGEESDGFRQLLDQHEIEALTSIRSRAQALSDELDAARASFADQETISLGALRTRLETLQDDASLFASTVHRAHEEAMASWRTQLEQVSAGAQRIWQEIGEVDERHGSALHIRTAELQDQLAGLSAQLDNSSASLAQALAGRQDESQLALTRMAEALTQQIAGIGAALDAQQERQAAQARNLSQDVESIGGELDRFVGQLQDVVRLGDQAGSSLDSAIATLAARLRESREALAGTDSAVAELTEDSVRLLELIRASGQHAGDDLPRAVTGAEDRLHGIEGRVLALREALGEAGSHGQALAGRVEATREALNAAMAELGHAQEAVAGQTGEQQARLSMLRQTLAEARSESEALAEVARNSLSGAIAELADASRATIAALGTDSDAAVKALAARLGSDSAAAIEQAMNQEADAVLARLQQAIAAAAATTGDAAMQMRDELARVDELTGNLERRVAQARDRAQEQVDNGFARRVALITEALNSTSIDIAKLMSNEVTDTAWAAYLRGDRGIFTRRAVHLLNRSEARQVAQFYKSDDAFREHVNQYVHDFEAMLRNLLSTRDGNTLAVTLLSSDMGKLYVALAQAIERLRA